MKRIQMFQGMTHYERAQLVVVAQPILVATTERTYTHAQVLTILGGRHKAKDEAGGVIAFAKNNLLDDQMKRLKKEVI